MTKQKAPVLNETLTRALGRPVYITPNKRYFV